MRWAQHFNSLRDLARALAYLRRVRPPVVKMLADAWSDDIIATVHGYGGKVVARRVEELGDDWQGNIDRTLKWAAERGWRMDYLEWANEESQGKDNVDEWDRLCRYALKFCQALDARRVATRGCVLNTSCGQPEEGYWERPVALELARYCAAHGHVIGVHEYYRPVPWQGVPWRRLERGVNDWGTVDGAWVLRIMQAVWVWRRHGIRCGFIVTESDRDAMSGTPGIGAGYRDEPQAPFALYALWRGRHYSAIPECVGWVGFGWGGSPRWASFDHADDPVTLDATADVMVGLPQGAATMPPDLDLAALGKEAHKKQLIELNPGAGLQKSALARARAGGRPGGYWVTSPEYISNVPGPTMGRHCQRFEDPDSGAVWVGAYNAATDSVDWFRVPKT